MNSSAANSKRKRPKKAFSHPSRGEEASLKDKKPFPIVGMGGSAGGLEAFEQFLSHLPPDTGMAFVLVPHLDPTHKGLMPELLQHHTRMPVTQVEDGMTANPNSVYVIPPNKDLAILHGSFQLLEPSAPRGMRLPIDFFFRQLAEDQGENAVGIILSGMGTDGTLGLKAIKEKLGMTMVQDIHSAKYDSMPRSALATGLVDYIAPAEELPAKLIAYAQHSPRILREGHALVPKTAGALLQKIFILLRAQTRHDFSFYKKNTIYRRLERRMSVHQIDKIEDYVRYLQANPQELHLLFKEFLIGVTNFFRDPEAFAVLQEKAIHELLQRKAAGDSLRVWIAGCSTGEEAYAIAMVISECLERLKGPSIKIQIFATDIDQEAIDKARLGIYPANIAADVSAERLQKYFLKEDAYYRINQDIRDKVVFAPQNLIMDPSFTKLDLLSCRNVLIYMDIELQKRLLPLFHYALNPGGALFLGSAESIGGFTDLFSPLDSKWKLYKREESVSALTYLINFPSLPPTQRNHITQSREITPPPKLLAPPELAQQILLEHFTPPAVLITEKGDILYVHGRTGKYLEPAAGKANMNVFAMAREGLRSELGIAIHLATTQHKDLTRKDVKVKTNGDDQIITIRVKPVSEPQVMQGLLIVTFEDVATPSTSYRYRKRKSGLDAAQNLMHEELQRELKHTRAQLLTTIEEMRVSQEELTSNNEELQSTNEELQSTNEELNTSKEELQSLNEELLTLNVELQQKIDELSKSRDDIQNLFNSTDISTLFLDNDLNIKRFTPRMSAIVNLITSDVGRPIAHVVFNLQYEDLIKDMKAVLETLVFKETQVQTNDGHWYLMRILPYRTSSSRIEGVVITFTDITAVKRLEQALREKGVLQAARNYAESIVATVREPLIVLDGELRVVSANRSFYQTFQVIPEETEQHPIYDLGNGQWNIPALKQLLEDILPKRTQFENFLVEQEFPRIGRKVMQLNARRVYSEDHKLQLILLAIEDLTDAPSKGLQSQGLQPARHGR
jgi:Methylase of chemotaxis methyl-accepting proteins